MLFLRLFHSPNCGFSFKENKKIKWREMRQRSGTGKEVSNQKSLMGRAPGPIHLAPFIGSKDRRQSNKAKEEALPHFSLSLFLSFASV